MDSIKRESNLRKKISCPFTGTSFDHLFIDVIVEFVNNPNDSDTYEDIINQCDEALSMGYDAIVEDRTSEESILSTIEANEYEFDEDGNISSVVFN